MQDNGYYTLVTAELLGNAGTQSPGEREQRYAPYAEKVRLKQPEKGE